MIYSELMKLNIESVMNVNKSALNLFQEWRLHPQDKSLNAKKLHDERAVIVYCYEFSTIHQAPAILLRTSYVFSCSCATLGTGKEVCKLYGRRINGWKEWLADAGVLPSDMADCKTVSTHNVVILSPLLLCEMFYFSSEMQSIFLRQQQFISQTRERTMDWLCDGSLY